MQNVANISLVVHHRIKGMNKIVARPCIHWLKLVSNLMSKNKQWIIADNYQFIRINK